MMNNNVLSDVVDILKANHFYDSRHQKIYQSMMTLLEKRINIHHITLAQHLKKDSLFADFDLSNYLQSAISLGMVIPDPVTYATIIQDMFLRRELIYLAGKINQNALTKGLDYGAISQIEECENSLFNLATEGVSNKAFESLSDGIATSIDIINKNRNSKTKITGIPSQFKSLDQITSGFHNGDLFILAARPGMGKTTLALNFMYNTAIHLGEINQSVGIFSLEMPTFQLSNKLLAMDSGVNSSNLISGQLREEEYNRIRISANRLSKLSIYVDDTGGLSISSIRSRARRLKRKSNLGILFVDYLQLIQPSRPQSNRVNEISEITQSLKSLAKELKIPIIALSQLSRAVEQRQDKRPLLSDLRESGSIEQDADIVMFIYRDEYYNKDLDSNKNIAELIISKHRNGRIGSVKMKFFPEFSEFRDMEEEFTEL